MTFSELLNNFFTHKDYLPSADKIPGTLFTPLHLVFAAVCLAAVIFFAVFVAKKSEKTMRTVFAVLWGCAVVLEAVKILWETYTGKTVQLELSGVLPLYPCSIFMYAMPFAIWGRGKVRYAACGYVCTLGLLGASINFIYPANILQNYSCISFAGFHTFFFHGTMLFSMLVMLFSGYHRYNGVEKPWEFILPAMPMLIMSIPANIINFSPIGSDYMFFKCNSFFLPALFGSLPDGVTTVLAYLLYAILPASFYLPMYFYKRRQKSCLN
jgi:hypothetical protein